MENVLVKIKLLKISDLYEFVKTVQPIRNKVVARQGLYQVDAGSILGLCCLDLASDFVVSIPAESAHLLEKRVEHEGMEENDIKNKF